MKLRVIFWAALGGIISGLLFWRNTRRYPARSVTWRITKSASEIVILLVSALRLPVVLISWCGIWLSRPIETPWIRVTVGAVAVIILSFFALYAMELLILIGVFSIDDITGEREGFLKNLRHAQQAAA
jgi:hypothetical protein